MSELTVKMIRGTDEIMDGENYHPILGGRDLENPPDWEGYLGYFKETANPYFETLKQFVIDHGYVGSTGEEMDDSVFEFSDGVVYGFSWRGWGDFMQAVVGKREGYMKYYM